MATSRKRHLTDEEIRETMSNSGSDLSSEDELLTAFDYVTIDSGNEDLPREDNGTVEHSVQLYRNSLVNLVYKIRFHWSQEYRLIIFNCFLMRL